MTNESTALAIPQGQALADVFRSAEAVDPIIQRIRDEVQSHAPDLTTAKGRDAIKSLAYKVSRSKTALDDAGKKLTEDARSQISVIDKARKKIRDELDALRDEARKPLTDWEEAEEARVALAKQALADVKMPQLTGVETSHEIANLATNIKAVVIPHDAEEYGGMILSAREATLETLRHAYSAAKRNEDQAAELEAMRAEKQARDDAERAERERMEAEAEAKRQAEQQEAARVEAERVAAERAAQIERDKTEAAERAASDARIAAERAAEQAREDADRAAKEAEERHAKALADAKAETEAAAQRERDRIAAERQAEADARAKRESDKAHRRRIRDDIATSMNGFVHEAEAYLIADAIMSGAIPHVKVDL